MWKPALLLLLLSITSSKVAFLIELCRHGARSPIVLQDWDLDGRWADGPGQLTPAGMRQHYLIGLALRNRFPELFDRNYTQSMYKVVSTDVDRTIMSAESQLLSLFPSSPASINSDRAVPPLLSDFSNLTLGTSPLPNHYQPVPVHTVAVSDDLLLRPQMGACAKLTKMDREVFTSEEASKTIRAYPSLLAALQQVLGQDETYVLSKMENILDSLECNRFQGNQLPPPLTADILTMADTLQNELFSMTFKTKTAAELWSSSFLSEVLSLLESPSNNTQATLFRLYSAHDTTMAGVLSGLEAFDSVLPPFASTLLFEVSDDQTLQVVYNDKPLNITACGDVTCSVETFSKYLRSRISKDIQKDCENKLKNGEDSRLESHLGHWLAWFLLSILIMGLFSAASAVFASFIVSKRHLHQVEAQDIEGGGHSSGR